MQLLLIEGQPGSGKTTFVEKICGSLADRNAKFVLNDEYRQDTAIFGDLWEDNTVQSSATQELLLTAWRKYIFDNQDDNAIHIFDNSLMNHIQYLMAITTPEEEVMQFFSRIAAVFEQTDARMVFLDGDSEIVIKRVDAARKNGWGERVAAMLEGFPYQQQRNRKGKSGMAKFFSDSQALKRKTLEYWTFPLLKVDITEGHWPEYEARILSGFILPWARTASITGSIEFSQTP